MIEAGQAFGEQTTLGALYTVTGEAQREIARSWYGYPHGCLPRQCHADASAADCRLLFQFETSKKYLKPLMVLYDDLKTVKANLDKVEKDRLYLDATKQRGEAVRAVLD